MDEEVFNLEVRKFLKKVGIQSQREIEHAVRYNIEKGTLIGTETLPVSAVLLVPDIGVKVSIEGEIDLT
ncbi:MAG: DUF6494 family protein [Pseudomonadota bacterium]|nr:DUF6494 family protein [Pseudomonadota bacterium]